MTYSIAQKTMALAVLLVFLSPLVTLAHETHIYEIGEAEYQIVIGSLNEPVVVDDKTGVDLRITKDGEPFVGAQELLQVEMLAGGVSRIDAIEPAYGVEGQYDTMFIPTIPTTLQYRVFGELEGVPFDQTYTCNPVGHPRSEENTERVEVSEGVVQTLARGNFGCPQPKEVIGFPEEAPSLYNLHMLALEAGNEKNVAPVATPEVKMKKKGVDPVSAGALALALIAVFLGLYALRKAEPKTPSSTTIE